MVTDPIAFLTQTPEGFFIIAISMIIVVAVLAVFVLMKPKGNRAIVYERLRSGWGVFSFGIVKTTKAASASGIPSLHLDDGRELPIPRDLSDSYETVNVPKSMKIPRGVLRFFPVERNQVVKFNESLTEQNEGVIEPTMIPKYGARTTIGRILTWKGGAANWTMLIMMGAAAFAIGYILYPQFNHAPTIIEYCQKLANGTLGSCSPFP